MPKKKSVVNEVKKILVNESMSEYFRQLGRKGGKARAAGMTASERRERARYAGSHKGKKKTA